MSNLLLSSKRIHFDTKVYNHIKCPTDKTTILGLDEKQNLYSLHNKYLKYHDKESLRINE